MGSLAGIVAVLQPRWSGAAVRDADHRYRRPHRALRESLPARASARCPILRVAVRLHGRDARRRAERQHPHPVRLLGADGLHVVPSHRLRTRAGRCSIRGPPGADRHRRRRPGTAGGRRAAHRRDGHDERVGHGRGEGLDRDEPLLCRDRGPGPPGGVHEVSPGALPFLAAERHGGAHPRERVPPLRHHGQGGDLPHRTNDPRDRHDADLDDGRDAGRRRDDGRRGLSRRAGNRPQAHPRLLDSERARRADHAARSGHARGHRGGARLSRGARLLQGGALPGCRHHRPRGGQP